MINKRFEEANKRVNPENKAFVKKNLDLIEQITHLLEDKGWTQKTLAQKLEKSESEVSKWLSGLHNFTLQTIIKLEFVLNEQILVVPIKFRETVVKEVQNRLVDEIFELMSKSLKLSNQVVTHKNITTQNWYAAAPIKRRTTFSKVKLRSNSEKQNLSNDFPVAA